jgi:hypothetical protein
MSSRQERAVEVVALIERRGLRFKLDGDLIVIVTSSPIAPEELRQLVERLGGDEGTHDDPRIAGFLLPYVLSALKQRRDVEEVAIELRGKVAFSPEYGWGTVAERESEGRLIFAMAERARQLSLYPNNLVLIVPEEQLGAIPDGETKPSAEADPKPKRSFWEYFRGAASGKAD